jgi:hypothetical protein
MRVLLVIMDSLIDFVVPVENIQVARVINVYPRAWAGSRVYGPLLIAIHLKPTKLELL